MWVLDLFNKSVLLFTKDMLIHKTSPAKALFSQVINWIYSFTPTSQNQPLHVSPLCSPQSNYLYPKEEENKITRAGISINWRLYLVHFLSSNLEVQTWTCPVNEKTWQIRSSKKSKKFTNLKKKKKTHVINIRIIITMRAGIYSKISGKKYERFYVHKK